MARQNKSPFEAVRNGIAWWRYSFWHAGKNYRGWIGACAETSRRAAVAAFKAKYAAIVTSAEAPEIRRRNVPAADIFKEYSAYLQQHHASTYETYRFCEPHFNKFFGGKTDIDASDIADYQAGMLKIKSKAGRPFSKATINRHLDYCRAAYHHAKVDPNPFKNFDKFREHERTRYLNEDELRALLEQVALSPNTQLRGIVLTAIMTGLRKENILELHARHIDFGHGVIRIEAKGAQDITVPIPDLLKILYKRNLKEHKSGYVFENSFTGTKFYDIKRSWHQCLKDAKVKDFKFHDLRHTFATYMLLITKNVRLVQDLLGHRSITMTQKYTHILMEQKSDAIELLSKLFSSQIVERLPGEEEK